LSFPSNLRLIAAALHSAARKQGFFFVHSGHHAAAL
jgi:hypothetical protein